MWQLGEPGRNAVLGSQQICWFREMSHMRASHWGTACPDIGTSDWPQKLFWIFLDLQKTVFAFSLSGEWLCKRVQFPRFQRQDSLLQRNVMPWRSRNKLSHPCSLSLSFFVYLPLRNSQILGSWFFSARLCVSYLHLQQRGLSGRLPR